MAISLFPKLIILAAIISITASSKSKVLHLGGFIPMDVSSSGGWSASGILPALDMGLSDVNQRQDILPNYYLSATWGDTHVSNYD